MQCLSQREGILGNTGARDPDLHGGCLPAPLPAPLPAGYVTLCYPTCCKRPSFASQKTAFQTVKGCLLERKRLPLSHCTVCAGIVAASAESVAKDEYRHFDTPLL